MLSASIPPTSACEVRSAPPEKTLRLCTEAAGPNGEYLLGPASVTGKDVASAVAQPAGQGSTTPIVEVTLDAAGKNALAKLTASLAGNAAPMDLLAIVSGGKIIGLPLVMTPLSDGSFQIAGISTMNEAMVIAHAIGG